MKKLLCLALSLILLCSATALAESLFTPGTYEAVKKGFGGDVKVTVRDQEYTVFTVDELRDDTDTFHHWEIGLR